jgi:hypothetical protein
MTVIGYKDEHLTKIRVKEIHQGEVPQTILCDAMTVMDGNQPVAIFGSFTFVPGVYHIWGLISEDVRQKPLAFHRISRELLAFYEKSAKPRRIQVDVKASYIEGQRWAKALGFEYEGTMKRFGVNGEDFHLYGRVMK